MRTFRDFRELAEAIKDKPFPNGSFFFQFQQAYSIYLRCCKCVRGQKLERLRGLYSAVKSLPASDIELIKTALGEESIEFLFDGQPLFRI